MGIEEKRLILPSLYIIDNEGTATTSELIEKLTLVFKPTGEDAEILADRKDTKFSQKVRNLKSHRDSNGMADWTVYDGNKYSLAEDGKAYLKSHTDEMRYLFDNCFDYEDNQNLMGIVDNADGSKKKIGVYDENEMVTEGKAITKQTATRKRSQKLRGAAIARYTKEDGSIACAVCGFDFEKEYGALGKGYIEIHHEHPIFESPDEGIEEHMANAVEQVKPVCSNCHRMLHRNANSSLSIEELKKCRAKL